MTLGYAATWQGLAVLACFLAAYVAAISEERLGLRKSVPVLIAAALAWLLVGWVYTANGESQRVADLARHTLLDFAELFLFLIASMTFVNTLEERRVFDCLRAWLIGRGFSLRRIFWITGGLAFVVSAVANNLTTALLLGTVALSVGQGHPRFVLLACINIVVAANAGGVFSPFGDITSLMVWQAGQVSFADFFKLFLPALVNWLVPAVLLSLGIRGLPTRPDEEQPVLEHGAVTVVVLFFATIALTVALYSLINLPPALGMMAGLGLLKGYSYVLNLRQREPDPSPLIDELDDVFAAPELEAQPHADGETRSAVSVVAVVQTPSRTSAVAAVRMIKPLDTFALLERIEWDTLLFFYGVLMCVGALDTLGYLTLLSHGLYGQTNATSANVVLGLLSAMVDNVPVMFAVLQMSPPMNLTQWLLVTLTTGVGGSLLSIGSAAGVALMGQARGMYTFGAHLRWTWAIALGFALSIATHLLLSGEPLL